MIDYTALGKRIKVARKKQKLTQQQLAEMAGVEPNNLSHIERGVLFPIETDMLSRINRLKRVRGNSFTSGSFFLSFSRFVACYGFFGALGQIFFLLFHLVRSFFCGPF